MLGKDFFRNGQNTQFACILMGWTEKNVIFPRTKHNVEVIKSVHFKILISFKIVVVFNTTSADFVLMSADIVLENNHNFERNEDHATIFLK